MWWRKLLHLKGITRFKLHHALINSPIATKARFPYYDVINYVVTSGAGGNTWPVPPLPDSRGSRNRIGKYTGPTPYYVGVGRKWKIFTLSFIWLHFSNDWLSERAQRFFFLPSSLRFLRFYLGAPIYTWHVCVYSSSAILCYLCMFLYHSWRGNRKSVSYGLHRLGGSFPGE